MPIRLQVNKMSSARNLEERLEKIREKLLKIKKKNKQAKETNNIELISPVQKDKYALANKGISYATGYIHLLGYIMRKIGLIISDNNPLSKENIEKYKTVEFETEQEKEYFKELKLDINFENKKPYEIMVESLEKHLDIAKKPDYVKSLEMLISYFKGPENSAKKEIDKMNVDKYVTGILNEFKDIKNASEEKIGNYIIKFEKSIKEKITVKEEVLKNKIETYCKDKIICSKICNAIKEYAKKIIIE